MRWSIVDNDAMGLLDRGNIENAMAKGPECHRRMTNVSLVREHYFEYADVSNDWRGDGRDEKKDGRYKQAGHAYPGSIRHVSLRIAPEVNNTF